MDLTQKNKLKYFMEENFDFYGLKKAGFFKGIRKTDYEKQAERVCIFFGIESIYVYGPPCRGVSCDGKCGSMHRSEYCKSYKDTGIKFEQFKLNIPEMLTKKSWLN